MKIELPLETWTELFGSVPRSQLIQLVPHFGEKRKRNNRGRICQQTIGDRTFVTFVQFFLHKFGEVTLGQLCIFPNGDEPCVRARANRNVPLADVPISANIKNFESILIRDYDEFSNYGQSVFAFMQEFHRNSLLANVKLHFYTCPTHLLQIMTNFLPLFTKIDSIKIDESDVLDKFQCEYSVLAIPMLTSARFLYAVYNCRDSWFCDWLHIPREDGKPRVLYLHGYQKDRSYSPYYFYKHIKKDFLEANQAVSFVIVLNNFRDDPSVQSMTLENGKTHEKLVIGLKTQYNLMSISRYPMGMGGQARIEAPNMDYRLINL